MYVYVFIVITVSRFSHPHVCVHNGVMMILRCMWHSSIRTRMFNKICIWYMHMFQKN